MVINEFLLHFGVGCPLFEIKKPPKPLKKLLKNKCDYLINKLPIVMLVCNNTYDFSEEKIDPELLSFLKSLELII